MAKLNNVDLQNLGHSKDTEATVLTSASLNVLFFLNLFLVPPRLSLNSLFFSPPAWHVGSRKRGRSEREGRKESMGGRRRRGEPQRRGRTVCLHRTARYWERSNLPPLGRLPVTSNRMSGGSLQTEPVVSQRFCLTQFYRSGSNHMLNLHKCHFGGTVTKNTAKLRS